MSRLLQGIFGFIVPLVLFLTVLFCTEYVIEITLGVMAFLINEAMGTSLDTTPDFPGPTNIIKEAIAFFPDVWDLGTLLFYGTIGHGTFLLYVIVAVLAAVTGVGAFKTLKTQMKDISDLAILRSGMRFTWSKGDNGDNGTPPPPPTTCTYVCSGGYQCMLPYGHTGNHAC